MVYARHLLSFWESATSVCVKQTVPESPVKILGVESLMGFLRQNHYTRVAAFL